MVKGLVTCIVPVHNGERYLPQALTSVVAQTHRPLEIIVVDDGSTDDSARVATSGGGQVAVVRQPRRGQPAASNAGADLGRGEFLAFLDADDVWHPDKLRTQLARLATTPPIDYCVTQVKNFVSPELGVPEQRLSSTLFQPMAGYYSSALVVRSRVFAAVGAFDPERVNTHVVEWLRRAAEHGIRGEVVAQVLVRRRLHLANRSQLEGDSMRDAYLDFIKDTLDRRRQRQPSLERMPTSRSA